MQRYNPKEIEPRWQQAWEDSKIYQATEDSTKPKKYILEYFPYPSGAAMHVGHVRNYTIGDAMTRYYRMQGFNVLHPMGWDSFGLPAENYAIKNNISPRKAIDDNTTKFKQQLIQMGFSYDWSREIDSSDPHYYRWTQWFFELLFEKGLAYQKESLQWWCEHDKTVLANEQVEAGLCWRCGNPVTKKSLKQWFFKILDYADRLADDLEKLDWSDSIKSMQRNWIGKSKGAEISFKVVGPANQAQEATIKVFTTRPDTLFGATFMVLAPEHPLVTVITTESQKSAVDQYIIESQAKSDIERQEQNRTKTGCFTGAYASNPATKQEIPIWIADYVLPGYGTGAIMAVPAHDERDNEFAHKFDLPITKVVVTEFIDELTPPRDGVEFVERLAAQAIVKHPTDDTYLLLKKIDWETESYSFVTGGIDDGETADYAAKREIIEETGYSDITGADALDGQYYVQFYHEGKKVNRRAQINTVVVTLGSLKRDAVTEDEKNRNQVLWVSAEELLEKIHGDGSKINFRMYLERTTNVLKTDEGTLVNSGIYTGVSSSEAREKIVADLEKENVAKEVTNYKIRDWLISRQRYWGAPIPVVHCPKDGVVLVPKDQLPVVLPELESYQPNGEGTSVLASVPDWVNVDCPKCGGPAKRETDTMDGFACSSWYFLRFADPHNNEEPFSRDKAKLWLPVDDYIGGAEHAVMHLLYARMWTKVMFDDGMIDFDEPFTSLRNHGMILAPDGQKMSKSKGNVIAPDELISQGYGADAIRIMELFIAPWNQEAAWSINGIAGAYRFLQRIWTLVQEMLEDKNEVAITEEQPEKETLTLIHKTIKKVTLDLEDMGFNTAIAALMECVNGLYKLKGAMHMQLHGTVWTEAIDTLLRLTAPFAPHMSEELWQQLGHTESIHMDQWPKWDEKYLVEAMMTIAVQVNGKLRSTIQVPSDATKDMVIATAKTDEKIKAHLESEPSKTIYVPGKLVNFVA